MRPAQRNLKILFLMTLCFLLGGFTTFAQDRLLIIDVPESYNGLAGVGRSTLRVDQVLPTVTTLANDASDVILSVPSNAVLRITAQPVNLNVGADSFESFVYQWQGDVPENLENTPLPHPTNFILRMDADKEINLIMSREYFVGEGVGDLDLDGLPDEWEIEFGLDPENAAGANGANGNPSGDFMPGGWDPGGMNRFASGAYPAVINTTWPYQFHASGVRPNDFYRGVIPFNNWFQARGFDGWFGANPALGNVNDDPGTNPTLLSTSENDQISDGWKYYFYGSAIHLSSTMTGTELGNYTDPSNPAPTVPITTAEILGLFGPAMAVDPSADPDNDCATLADEFAAFSDPLHWDTDADLISDGYEIRFVLNPVDAGDADDNPSGDWMAFLNAGGEQRHFQVYNTVGYDPRTGWGRNYQGRDTNRRTLEQQVNTVEFNNREKYFASVYLAAFNGQTLNCDNFGDFALDPFDIDTDDDGIFDGWELYLGLNPADDEDSGEDADGDLLTNFQEFSASDINELRGVPWPNGAQHFDPTWFNKVWPTDPNNVDTDGDGLADSVEGGRATQANGRLNASNYRYANGINLNWNGFAFDGAGLNPTTIDTDGDRIPDHWETLYTMNAFNPAGDDERDGMDGTTRDAGADYDEDGLLNYQEYLSGAVHHWRYSTWTPGLGLGGYDPVAFFTGDPNLWDWNNATVLGDFFYIEHQNDWYTSINPRDEDTDGDGMDDYWEIYHGLNPLFGTLDIHDTMVQGTAAPILAGIPPNFDVRIAPHVAGSPYADPDQDGLPNYFESIQPNTGPPGTYHTDPSPSWMTDTSYQLSHVNLYYANSLALPWFFPLSPFTPTYAFSFENVEGFDTDNDGLGDRAELVHTMASPGTTDPLRPDSPPRRRALYLDGDAAARTRGSFLHEALALRQFTVEAWVRAENPASGTLQVIVERPVEVPIGNIMNISPGIRLNFRLALDPAGVPFVAYNGSGSDSLYQEAKAQLNQALEPDRWYHLAGVYDGAGQRLILYINGTMRASIPSAEIPATGRWPSGNEIVFDAPLIVGASDQNPSGWVNGMPVWAGLLATTPPVQPSLAHNFQGWVDEVRIWDGARNAADIAEDMMTSFQQNRIRETAAQTGTRLMYLYNFDSLLDPVLEGIRPDGFNLLNGRPNDGSYPNVPWWGTATDRSLVYNDYLYVPWIPNMVARLPLDPPADAPFMSSERFGAGSFANSANPYNFAYYHDGSILTERHPEYNVGVLTAFDTRDAAIFNDLLPLRFARADASVSLWDGAGTGIDVFDSNGDGIPDWWELQYGFDPLGESIAEEDLNGDGINNLWAYRLGADPGNAFSLDPAGLVYDADFDSDGDGLSNLDELAIYLTDPTNPDADDDTLSDGAEALNATDPRRSISPFVFNAMRFGASGGSGAVTISDRINGEATGRLSLDDFTIEFLMRPEVYPVGPASLITREVENNGRLNYQVTMNASGTISARFQNLATTVELSSTNALPLNEWSHIAVRYDQENQEFALFIDGMVHASVSTLLLPATGAGDMIIGGDSYQGYIKELRIWSVARSNDDLLNLLDRNLFFGAGVSDPGLLRTAGDDGHLQQISSTLDPVTLLPVDALPLNWTLEAWVKTTDDGGVIISRWNAATGQAAGDYNYYLGIENGKLLGRFAIAYELVENEGTAGETREPVINTTINDIRGVTRINDGAWHHVAFIRDAEFSSLYVDGELDQRQPRFLIPLDDRIRNATTRVLDGPLTFGYDLAADLDEIRVWNRGLTTAELRDVNQRSLFGNENNLVTYFNFDYQRGKNAEERSDLRDNEIEFGRFINTAEHIRSLDVPPIAVDPLVTYRLILAGYFAADDGGLTVEDFVYPLDADFAGVFSGDAAFATLTLNDLPYQQDSNDDGIPNWWYIQYGLDPAGESLALEDWDSDGLINLYEYLFAGDPWNAYSLDGGGLVSDGQYDSDGDGLSNLDEINVHGTRPDLADTDDDGVSDGDELNPLIVKADGRSITSPTHSRSPLVQRSLELTGAAITVPGSTSGGDDRFASLSSWTVELWVNPDAAQSGSLVKHEVDGLANLEVRLDANVPTVRFQTRGGATVRAGGTVALPAGEWTHLAAVFDDASDSLALYVNGSAYRAQATLAVPAIGEGVMTLGDTGLTGNLDELRIWSIARTAEQIADNRDRIINTPRLLANGLTAYYRFDDGGLSAEDTMRLPDLPDYDYGLTGVTFDEVTVNALSGLDDFNNNDVADWWEGLFFAYAPGGTTDEQPEGTNAVGLGLSDLPNSGDTVWRQVDAPITDADGAFGSPPSYGYLIKDFYLDIPQYPQGFSTSNAYVSRIDYRIVSQGAGLNVSSAFGANSSSAILINGEILSGTFWNADLDLQIYSEVIIDGTPGDPEASVLWRNLRPGHNRITVPLYNASGGANTFDLYLDVQSVRLTYNDNTGSAILPVNRVLIPLNSSWGLYAAAGLRSVPPNQSLQTDTNQPSVDVPWTDRFYGMNAAERQAALDYDPYVSDEATVNPDNGVDLVNDPDSDLLSNLYEYLAGTHPKAADTDNDGVLDRLEDAELDGLSNLGEQEAQSHPRLADTDDDGLNDDTDLDPAGALIPLNDRVLQLAGAAADYVQYPNSVRFALDSFTLQAWFKPSALGGTILARQVQAGVDNYRLELLPSGQLALSFTRGDGAGDETLTTAPAQFVSVGVWSHVAAAFDASAGRMTIFINGEQVATKTTSYRPAVNGVGPVFTRAGSGFNGLMDEVAIHNIAADAATIFSMLGGIGANGSPALISYYRFDDGGTSAQEFASGFEQDWMHNWRNAGGINGGATLVTAPADAPVNMETLDSNGDCIPDWWAILFGFNPAGESIAGGDADGDGLSNLYEYLLGGDPNNAYSLDGTGQNMDGVLDSDGDGLSNSDEINVHGTRPDLPDTDDDGVNDGDELNPLIVKADGRSITSPTHSRSPLVQRSMVLDGAGHVVPAGSPDRFALSNWTVEAWVRLDTVAETGVIIRRRNADGRESFELGVNNNRPYVRFETAAGAEVIAGGAIADAIPANEWVHLAGVFDDEKNTLQLYVNGVGYRAQNTLQPPVVSATAITEAGAGLNGLLDELRVWNVARTSSQILASRDRIINTPVFFSTLVAYYRFDDGENTSILNPITGLTTGFGAEDSAARQDWTNNWASAIDVTAFSTTVSPVYGLDDFDGNDVPDWWQEMFTDTEPRAIRGVVPYPTNKVNALESLPFVNELNTNYVWGSPVAQSSQSDRFVLYDVYLEMPSFYCSFGTVNVQAISYEIAQSGIAEMFINGERDNADGFSMLDEVTGRFSSLKPGHNRIAVEISTDGNYELSIYVDYILLETSAKGELFAPVQSNILTDISIRHTWQHTFSPPVQTLASGELRPWFDTNYGMSDAQVDQVNAPYFSGPQSDFACDPASMLDYDNDGLSTTNEYFADTNPKDPDSDNDGVPDAAEDPDADGLSNLQEQEYGAHPTLPDTDDDGLPDGFEVSKLEAGANPTNACLPAVDRSLRVTGNDHDYLALPADRRFALSSFTLAAWINPAANISNNAQVIAREVADGVRNYDLGFFVDSMGSRRLALRFDDDTGNPVNLWASNNIPLNAWSHVAATFDANNGVAALYINGRQVRRQAYGQIPLRNAAGPLTTLIGRRFNGLIDEAVIWNRAATSNEIAQIESASRNADINLIITNLTAQVAYLRFNDGTNPNGVSGAGWLAGQAQDDANRYPANWLRNWRDAGTLRGAAAIALSRTTPGVIDVTSPNLNGIYFPGQTITIDVTMSRNISRVQGSPFMRLALEGGATGLAAYAGYSANTLSFRYTIGTNQWSWDLDYLSVSALDVSTSRIQYDNGGVHADFDPLLPPPGSFGSLGWNKDIIVDPPETMTEVNLAVASWLGRYYPSAPVVWEADDDGDGMTNEEEALAGTNPLDAADVLQITGIRMEGGQIVVSWEARPDRNYRLEQVIELNQPHTWSLMPGTTTNRMMPAGTSSGEGSAGFYRLKVAP